jgi:hypothetical protein
MRGRSSYLAQDSVYSMYSTAPQSKEQPSADTYPAVPLSYHQHLNLVIQATGHQNITQRLFCNIDFTCCPVSASGWSQPHLNSIPHSHSQCELDIRVSLWIFERYGKVGFLFSD